jgi:nucleotide-binding universal stress UspA family protein
MAGSILLCTDGSDLSTRALLAGLAVVRPDTELIVATVAPMADLALVTGTGFAGGTMSDAEFEAYERRIDTEAHQTVDTAAERIGRPSTTVVLRGEPGPALCEFAAARAVEAIVIGTHGRGGLKRALLGSVSDHVVRHAPCPVIVGGHTEG